ncbi:MAG: hypothetical protein HY822_22935 [Acidobacteria bacterium]|nr:hypothetical protein [Acidobacteriota bacterium]
MSPETDRVLNGALRALAAESASRQAPARVEAAVLEKFRRGRVLRRWRWTATAAVAAMVLLAVALTVPRPARPPVAARQRVYTDFIPVAYGEPFRPEEGVRIVRVRMPRAALTTFGLPVNQDRLDERIQADVLLGEDNLVRAVRFEQ